MRAIKLVGAGLLAMAPMAGFAVTPGYLDLYYIPKASVEAGSFPEEDGDGYGVKLMAPVSRWGVLTGEYQTVQLDDSDQDLNQIRAGLGVMTGSRARFGAVAEYIRLELDNPGMGSDAAEGFGVHGRIELDPTNWLNLYGQLGYVRIDNDGAVDGLELSVGAATRINAAIGLFADYRLTKLEDEAKVEHDIADLRMGLRVSFGS